MMLRGRCARCGGCCADRSRCWAAASRQSRRRGYVGADRTGGGSLIRELEEMELLAQSSG